MARQRLCVFWIKKAIGDVVMVVEVLIINCQMSLQ